MDTVSLVFKVFIFEVSYFEDHFSFLLLLICFGVLVLSLREIKALSLPNLTRDLMLHRFQGKGFKWLSPYHPFLFLSIYVSSFLTLEIDPVFKLLSKYSLRKDDGKAARPKMESVRHLHNVMIASTLGLSPT